MYFDKFYKRIDYSYDKMVNNVIRVLYEVNFLCNEKRIKHAKKFCKSKLRIELDGY